MYSAGTNLCRSTARKASSILSSVIPLCAIWLLTIRFRRAKKGSAFWPAAVTILNEKIRNVIMLMTIPFNPLYPEPYEGLLPALLSHTKILQEKHAPAGSPILFETLLSYLSHIQAIAFKHCEPFGF